MGPCSYETEDIKGGGTPLTCWREDTLYLICLLPGERSSTTLGNKILVSINVGGEFGREGHVAPRAQKNMVSILDWKRGDRHLLPRGGPRGALVSQAL